MKKNYLYSLIFSVLGTLLLISFMPFYGYAQEEEAGFEIDFISPIQNIDLEYKIQQEVWDALFILVDYRNADDSFSTVGFYPIAQRTDLWAKDSLERAYFPRPFSEKIKLLGNLLDKYGKSSDVAVILASKYFSAGKRQEALKVMDEYISGAKPGQLVTGADFYHNCAMFDKEIDVLYSGLKKFEKNTRENIADRLLLLINDYQIKTELRDKVYDDAVKSFDNKEKWFERWLTDLKNNNQGSRAESVISDYRKSYPNLSAFFNRMEADIYFATNRTEKAVRLYYDILDPSNENGHFEEYFAALEKANQYNAIRRSLFDKRLKKTASIMDKNVLFRMYLRNGQNRQANAVLSEIRQDYASKGYQSADLVVLALNYKLAGVSDEAVRCYNELYERSKSDADKLNYLGYIASILYANPGLYPDLQDKGLEGWFRSITADNMPSVFGGILSLLYNKQQFNDTADGMLGAFISASSRKAFFVLADTVKRAFPSSDLASYLTLNRAGIYQNYNMWNKAVDELQGFIKNHPDSPERYSASEQLIRSYDVLKQFDQSKQVYQNLLDFADGRNEKDKYKQYFSSFINWLVSKKKMTDAVQVYWNEVRRHSSDEALYDEFLNFVVNNNITPEEIKIYKYALEKFQDSKWTHSLARWYIRQKQWKEYTEFSQKVITTFKDSDVEKYLREFEPYVPSSNADNFKKQLYLQLYKYSLDRFPFNSAYVNGLMQYYAYYKEWNDYYRLARRYYFINNTLRKAVLADFYRNRKAVSPLTINRLSSAIANAITAGTSTVVKNNDSGGIGGLVEKSVIAYHLSWFSYYEEAVDSFTKLAEAYPDEPSLIEYVASLHRSLKHTDEAVKYYTLLADSYPMNIKYLTLAGETLADLYQIELAVKYWDKIFELNPRNSEIANEVATIFWDYYQFDKSEAIILKIRKNLANESLFGTELAAVYESAKKYDKAVAEYIRSIALSEDYWWPQVDRLVTLSSRGKLGSAIKTGFSEALKKQPNNYNLVRACAQFYESIQDMSTLASVYTDLIRRTDDFGILSDIYYFFEERNDKDKLADIWLRKVDVAEDDEWLLDDTIAYFEDIDDMKNADSLAARRIARAESESDEFPDKFISILDKSFDYYERHTNRVKQAEVLNKVIGFTSGDQKRGYQVKLARFYIEEDKLDKAGEILKALVENYPDRADYFNALAEIYITKNDYKGLVDFYTDGLVRVKKASMHPARKQELLDNLRRGLIKGYEKLQRYPEAIDQYVEIINRSPKDENVLIEAWQFADKFSQESKLIGYYEKTAKESFKDFRWQLILARLYSWAEKYEASVEKYKAAIQNEPQMTELYYSLADVQIKLNRYQDAANTYAKLYRISKGDRDVLLLQAEMMMRSGKKKEALDIVKEATKDNPADYEVYFKTGRKLDGWGEYALALSEIQRGINKFKEKASETYLKKEDAEFFAQLYLKNGKSVEGVINLFDLMGQLEKKSREMSNSGNYSASYVLSDSVSQIAQAIDQNLGDYCGNYMSDADIAVLNRRMVEYYKKYKSQRRDLFLSFAERSGLFDLEEVILTDSSYWDTTAKMKYYSDRRNYMKLIGFIENYVKTVGSSATYQISLSKLYRITGNTKSEYSTISNFLKNYSTSTSEWYFTNHFYPVDRWLDLSFEDKNVKVESLYGGRLTLYTGALLNYLLKNRMYDQTFTVLNANPLKKPSYWAAAKKADLLRFLKKYDPKLETEIGKMLNLNPVKSLLGKRQSLDMPSDIWFRLALIYAKYLNGSQKPETARLYLPAPIEELPKAADKQILLADIYSEMGKYTQAIEHYKLVLQLQPKNNLAVKNLGAAQLKSGNKDAALNTWAEILKPNLLSDYELYMNILIENGFADKGINAFLKRINEAIDNREYKDEILHYISTADEKASACKIAVNVSDIINKLVSSRPDDFQLLNSVIKNETLLDEKEKTPYYERVLRLLASNPQTTVSVIIEWNHNYYNHLVRIENYKAALAFLEKSAGADKLQTEIWIPSEIIRMRNRLKLEPILTDLHEKYISARKASAYQQFISVLQEEKLEKLRNQLRIRLLDQEINKDKSFTDNTLASYADELYIAGKIKEADGIIKKLLTYKTDNKPGMESAAVTLEKHDYFDKAMDIRKNIAKSAPGDYQNTFSMMRLHIAMKQHKEALNLAQKILLTNSAGRLIRNKTADYLVEKLKAGDPILAPASSFFDQMLAKQGMILDENIFILNATIAQKNGNQAKAKEILVRACKLLANTNRAGLMLAELYDKEGAYANAIEKYKQVFARTPNDKRILARLFMDYYKMGDYYRAIKMIESYEYFPLPDEPLTSVPEGFVDIQNALQSDKDKIELLNAMEEAALKLESLSRANYYHNLQLPIVVKNESMMKKWKETSVQYKKQYADIIKKQKEAFSIRWEL